MKTAPTSAGTVSRSRPHVRELDRAEGRKLRDGHAVESGREARARGRGDGEQREARETGGVPDVEGEDAHVVGLAAGSGIEDADVERDRVRGRVELVGDEVARVDERGPGEGRAREAAAPVEADRHGDLDLGVADVRFGGVE